MILTTKMTFQKVHFISISISALSVLHIFILFYFIKTCRFSHRLYISNNSFNFQWIKKSNLHPLEFQSPVFSPPIALILTLSIPYF
ncbi:hypothetical protein Pint_07273 [Pistacia integerrima]|uniref:Uncharacterized protein n=1 Tax=Pistacia integerrima TaxID=434235 RepID=A0ACC0XWU8_9ROSI|nr:hypothetical protein Pint_07273 [Pistacia integerrima]